MARTSKASKAGKATKKSASGKKPAKTSAKKSPARAKKTAAKKSAATSGTPTSKSSAPSAGQRKKKTTKQSEGASAKSPSNAAAKKSTKSASRPKKVRSPFESRFLEKMRKSLIAEREVYERQATQLRAEAESLVADLDPGDVQFDEESGEGDTIAVERGRDLALAAKAMEMIDEIDHALSKFDLGTYGICEISEEPIPKERLEAIPWAREKVEFKVGGFGRR